MIAAAESPCAGLNFNLDPDVRLAGSDGRTGAERHRLCTGAATGHLSHYQLTRTQYLIYRRRRSCRMMRPSTSSRPRSGELARHGYPRYEVSAYARADRRCRHNLNYWEFGGLSRASRRRRARQGPIHRANSASVESQTPRDYLARAGRPASAAMHRCARPSCRWSFDECPSVWSKGPGAVRRNAGLAVTLEPGWSQARTRLLESDPERPPEASELGLRFLNDLLQAFMPEAEQV